MEDWTFQRNSSFDKHKEKNSDTIDPQFLWREFQSCTLKVYALVRLLIRHARTHRLNSVAKVQIHLRHFLIQIGFSSSSNHNDKFYSAEHQQTCAIPPFLVIVLHTEVRLIKRSPFSAFYPRARATPPAQCEGLDLRKFLHRLMMSSLTRKPFSEFRWGFCRTTKTIYRPKHSSGRGAYQRNGIITAVENPPQFSYDDNQARPHWKDAISTESEAEAVTILRSHVRSLIKCGCQFDNIFVSTDGRWK